MPKRLLRAIVASIALLSPLQGRPQAIGGSASIAVSSTSANVALPASITKFPAILMVPTLATTTEIFYAFGTSNAVTASSSSNALPPGGICFQAQGPATYVAAIDPSGTGNLRITQLSQCPPLVLGRSGSSVAPPTSPSYLVVLGI